VTVALITGATRGIGRATAIRLAADGHDVAIGFGHDREAAEALAAELRDRGGRAFATGGDLRDPAVPGRLVDETEEALGPVGILVANAGVNSPSRRLEEIELAEWDELLEINLRSSFLLAQRVLPGMADRGFGRIVLLSSVAAYTGGIIGAHYAASKAGLHGLTHHLASRVAEAGVTVNAIAPALIEHTDMLPGDPGFLARAIPVGRLGQPDEVADMAVAMLRNAYLTSKVISLDGGMHPR
jgi:3-oxoacyl-[acyl-carrier protein] reductase